MQVPLFTTAQSKWVAPNLSDLPRWEGVKRIGLDIETKDPYLKQLGPGVRRPDGYITGVSFAFEDGPSFYLPMRHEGGGNLPVDQVMRYLKDQCQLYDGTIVGANLGYDLDWLAESGVVFPNVKWIRDVQIADPLICELYNSYSLDAIAKRWDMPGKNEDVLRAAAADYKIDPKSEMWRLPAEFVGSYAEDDARLPLDILRRQERVIDDQDLWGVYDLESKLLPILLKIRRRGVRVHEGRLTEIERWSTERENEQLAEVKRKTGIKVASTDVWKAEALATVLNYLGVKLEKTKTGKPKIDKDLLKTIDHPVARALEKARKFNKLRTTFAQSVRNHMTNGRIHCTLNQLRRQKDGEDDVVGAAYGRLSSANPNMQQQPSRDEFAKMWRSIYLPEEDHLWAANDYSQQEPRMAVHYASIAKHLIGQKAWLAAIQARDHYRNDPNADNHQMMADMAGIPRKPAKDIYLGLSYGMGGPKLCRSLGLPTIIAVRGPRGMIYDVESPEGKALLADGARRFEAAGPEGQALLNTFDDKVPFVRALARAAEKKAKQSGYIQTLSGRRCRFPLDPYGNYDWTHKALNRLIQGSSADQTKTAMVQLDEAGFNMMLQVHDEVALNIKSREEAEAAADIMRHCVNLEVPSKVDVEIGLSWGESMG